MPSWLMQMLRVSGSTLTLYLFLIVGLRVLGRRALGQLTVVDLAIVIVLGSAVETSMIAGDTSLAAGLVSAGTLLAADRLLAAAAVRSKRFRHLLAGGPVLVVNDGRVVAQHLPQVGLTETDLMEGLRERGWDDVRSVRFAVLETDGTINVIGKAPPQAEGSRPAQSGP